MLKNTYIKVFSFSFLITLLLKILTESIKLIGGNFNSFFKRVGVADLIFSQPASGFSQFYDILILLTYCFFLFLLERKYYYILNNKYFVHIKYITFFFGLVISASTIVFQEYKAWDLNPYCQEYPINEVSNSKLDIYKTEYNGIKPGLSPLVWIAINKICNFTFFGLNYLNHFYWIFIFSVLFLIKKNLGFNSLDTLCLAFCFNLSYIHSIRSANYGFLVACLLSVFLLKEQKKNKNFNLMIIFLVSILKIHYLVIIFIYFVILKQKYKFIFKLATLNIIFYIIQFILFKNSTINYFINLLNGYLVNELRIKAGIFNPVTFQFFERIEFFKTFSTIITLTIVIYLFNRFKTIELKFLTFTHLFSRNKSYDQNYFLLLINNENINLFILILCTIPTIFYIYGSLFGLGLLSELYHVISVFFLIFNLEKSKFKKSNSTTL